MLVVARKSEEFIQIGKDIKLVVLSVHGNRVRLGIQASAELSISRFSAAPHLTTQANSTGLGTPELCPSANDGQCAFSDFA